MAIHGKAFILQRRINGDRNRWRSIGRFKPDDLPRVDAVSLALAALLEPITFRVVFDNVEQPVVKEFQPCE